MHLIEMFMNIVFRITYTPRIYTTYSLLPLIPTFLIFIITFWGGDVIYRDAVRLNYYFPKDVFNIAEGMFWLRMVSVICCACGMFCLSCVLICVLIAGGGMNEII